MHLGAKIYLGANAAPEHCSNVLYDSRDSITDDSKH